MAIGVFKLNKRDRRCLSLIFSFFNILQAILGSTITGTSIYVYVSLSPGLYIEGTEIQFVQVVTGIYGTHIIIHWLLGLKISDKCYYEAHKKSTRNLLFLWACGGTNTIINLIIIASMSKKINRHILKSLRNSLENGMQHYLTQSKWKFIIDKTQLTQQCCGIHNYQDWYSISWLNKYQVDAKASLVQRFKGDDNFHLPVTPFSCCKLDYPMQCLHDPLQQIEYTHIWIDEPSIATDSINNKGCLTELRKPITAAINTFIGLTVVVTILHVVIFCMARILYTSCKNAILLSRNDGRAPGWVFGRGDFGVQRGKTAAEIMGMETGSKQQQEIVPETTDGGDTTDVGNETSEEETAANMEEELLKLE